MKQLKLWLQKNRWICEKGFLIDTCLTAKDVYLFLDAGYSGIKVFGDKGVSRNTMKYLLEKSEGISIISSSLENQTSTEKSPSDKSLFTHYLCEALEGEPSALDDYYLTTWILYDYVTKKCWSILKVLGKRYFKLQQLNV